MQMIPGSKGTGKEIALSCTSYITTALSATAMLLCSSKGKLEQLETTEQINTYLFTIHIYWSFLKRKWKINPDKDKVDLQLEAESYGLL